MLSCSGECVSASPRTRVRRNSDLPEPVAPITRPCGPMPCWADSLMSRCTSPPPSPSPIGTRSRSRAGRGRQEATGSTWWTSPSPSRSMKSAGPVISSADSSEVPLPPAATVCSGVSRRANASAVARSHWSPSATTGASRTRSAWIGTLPAYAATRAAATRSVSGSSISSRSREASSSWSQRLGRSMRVTPCRPSGGITWLPGGRCPPSTTRRMCGDAGRSSAPKRGRSLRSGGRIVARSASEVVTMRVGPTASLCSALWAWGSHLTQSHWARFCSLQSTATIRWLGEWNAVAEQTSARAIERACSSGPHTSMPSKARRSMLAGRLGWMRWTTSRRCSADAAAGSTWSIGVLSGGTRSTESGCAHRP